MKVPVGISNRHVHLTKEDLECLFGKNYELNVLKKLNQPLQFASTDVVTIKTEKSQIDNVRVLGPIRSYTQVEISKTDTYKLGINPPIRESGDIVGSAPITIIGPNGVLEKKECCIIATRHIHITREMLNELAFDEDILVSLKGDGIKGGIMRNVSFRVSDDAYFEAHLDTDDANAFMIENGDYVEIVKEEC